MTEFSPEPKGCGCSSQKGSGTSLLSSLFLFLGLVAIAAALSVAGLKIYDGMRYFRSYDRFVTVKGLATQDVRADLAVWSVNFTVTGDDLPAAQAQLEENAGKVTAYLKTNGMSTENIRLQNIVVADKQAQTYSGEAGAGPRYVLSQAFIVRTLDIDAMIKATQNVSELVKQGVVLGQPNGGWNPAPQYLFTKLNDIKPQMIAQATKNARASAEQFAKDSGQKVSKIRSANQGVFEIQARDPALIETETPDKTVRVVSTVEYYLAE
jgi:hypothetical protein